MRFTFIGSAAPGMAMSSLLSQLNTSQREAVLTRSGPLLVLAGAGTGKTRVITVRMAELIRGGIPADRILSVTFTNKAAREMQGRISALLGKSRRPKPLVCTFHSLCVRILRTEIKALGYPTHFTIHARGDQESVARKALRDTRVPDTALKEGDLLARISRWKMNGVTPAMARDHIEDDRDLLAAAAYRKYQAALRAAAAVDFDDLLLLTHELFQNHPNVLARQQERFDHLQIDEYQDTNGMQFAIAEALVRPHRNICVVGDDDQSIYGWRGAELRHILGFSRIFPGAKVVRLQDNYRCTDQILQLANRLVKHNRERWDKKLIPHKVGRNSIRCAEFPDEQVEAERVVRDIASLVETQRVDPGEIAILFRTNEQPRVFELELRRAHLPYVVVGSQSFFDRKEIRDLLAYLNVLANPDDEISLLRIINVPARGIGDSSVQKVLTAAVQSGRPFLETAAAMSSTGQIPKGAAAGFARFDSLIRKYRQQFEEHPREMPELVRRLIDEIGYESEIERLHDDPATLQARTAVLDDFVESVQSYVGREETPTLLGFIESAALNDRDEETDKDEQLSERGVKLMTLHSAKGLEFPRVYLVGMEEGLLPHQRSVAVDTAESIAEERRLCYVGITRAKDFLTLTRAAARRKWGKARPSIPSRFLNEMFGDADGNADSRDSESTAEATGT
jgi:DNA helicase-2/ATP-dependent DNA helicase PcrA